MNRRVERDWEKKTEGSLTMSAQGGRRGAVQSLGRGTLLRRSLSQDTRKGGEQVQVDSVEGISKNSF